jgi:hypothetical protein
MYDNFKEKKFSLLKDSTEKETILVDIYLDTLKEQ